MGFQDKTQTDKKIKALKIKLLYYTYLQLLLEHTLH